MTPLSQMTETEARAPSPDDQHRIAALQRRVAELEAERDAAEAFAALAAHELMAPLVLTEATVALASERLVGHEDHDVVDRLDALRRAAGRTRLLVESLLHDASTRTRPLQREPVGLEPLARECIAVLEPAIESRNAEIAVGDLPEVRGESQLLAGLLTNLLANAVKFSPRQGSSVAIDARRNGKGWMVYVDSEGPLIAPEDRERIFQPFHRGQRERRIKGAGLGLAICRRIVERHGGTIGVETIDDRNRFFFTIPD